MIRSTVGRSPPGPDSLLARAVSQNHDCTLRQHSAADSLLKVPSQRTAVILADPAACSSRCIDRPRADLCRSAYGPASGPGGIVEIVSSIGLSAPFRSIGPNRRPIGRNRSPKQPNGSCATWIGHFSQGVGLKVTYIPDLPSRGGGWSTLAHWISPVFL